MDELSLNLGNDAFKMVRSVAHLSQRKACGAVKYHSLHTKTMQCFGNLLHLLHNFVAYVSILY